MLEIMYMLTLILIKNLSARGDACCNPALWEAEAGQIAGLSPIWAIRDLVRPCLQKKKRKKG